MKFLIYLFATLITLCFAVSSFALSLKNIIYYHTACPPNPYSTNHPPTNGPTNTPTNGLTNTPTNGLTNTPTNGPTNTPTNGPTNTPTNGPTNSPTNAPPLTNGLTNTPSNVPTSPTPNGSTNSPTDGPTNFPTSPPNNVCNPTGGVRIIGGTDAPSGAYPYQISVRNSNQNNSHFCGGSIISDRWILTAAHCVIGSLPADKTIVAGTNLLNSGGTSYAVEQIVMHPAYDDVNFVNDYALMKVSSAIAFGPTVATIPLATQRPPVGSSALATGWGYTNATLEQVSPNLQQICVSVISNEECENVWGDLPDTVVCTFNRDGEGMCRGDSGGPLVWKNRQFGIVSFGPQLCASGFPDAYASVPDGIVWVQNITGISN